MFRHLAVAALAGLCSALEALLPTAAQLTQIAGEVDSLRGVHTDGQQLPMPTTKEAFVCDVDSSGPICLGGQQRILLPPAKPFGLVGFWPFDEAMPLDVSGGGNHGVTSFQPGPAFGGVGASAFFRKTYLTIPGSDQLKLQDFTYTFWLRIANPGPEDGDGPCAQSGLKHCPILRKGLANGNKQTYAAAPAILFDREAMKLRVELATTGEGTTQAGEALESNAKLREGAWFHVAVVRLDGQKRLRLYVNGVLDASVPTTGYTQPSDEPLYVGGDPLSSEQCDMPVFIDELRVYNRPLTPDEIQAEAAPALNGVEPSFIRLACISCPLETAMQNCPEKYHICNSLELHMGGYQVARTLGYLKQSSHVWSHSTVANGALQKQGGMGLEHIGVPTQSPAQPPMLGLGLCCSDMA
jgi:hypothetical protein